MLHGSSLLEICTGPLGSEAELHRSSGDTSLSLKWRHEPSGDIHDLQMWINIQMNKYHREHASGLASL